jgi:hypothetical protein
MENFNPQELLRQAAGREALTPRRGESFVDWAIEMLCFGETNENIAILAGLRQPLYPHLAAADLELDITILTAPEALWYEIQNVARQIVVGEITPHAGCQKLYRLYYDLEYGQFAECRYFSDSLSLFLYLDEDYDFEANSEPYRLVAKNDSREEIDRCVIEEATRLLNTPVPPE